jgi:methylenetetrahydrofolate reductase (NADPH)
MAGRAADLPAGGRDAIVALLRAPKFELIPLKNVHDQSAFLPVGATVSVTASPAKGIEATIELCEQLKARGFAPVAHLSARMIRDRAHLGGLLARLAGAGIERAFVIGGDADGPGEFPDGLSLLRAMVELGHPFTEIGVPCYPQGHPDIPTERLLEALAAKQPYAAYMTTQMCFDPKAIGTFIAARRAAGITLPVHIGLPGVAELAKLAAISARIGVKDSRRFLSKNVRLVGQLVRPGGYRPDGLLESLAPVLADPAADVGDLHIYTFNQVETTEEWRHKYLATLGVTPTSPAPGAQEQLRPY